MPDRLASPGLTPDDCFIWNDESEYGIQYNRPRATAISYFAREYGARFQDVVCRRRYWRPLTRQESYSAKLDDISDAVAWDWADANGLLWRDGAWRDALGGAHEPPPIDVTVPEAWEPDDDCPVWEFCEKTAPGAIPCWLLELKA